MGLLLLLLPLHLRDITSNGTLGIVLRRGVSGVLCKCLSELCSIIRRGRTAILLAILVMTRMIRRKLESCQSLIRARGVVEPGYAKR